MRKSIFFLTLVALLTLSTSTAMAQNIKGKFGVTGRIGFLIPADSDLGVQKVETDAGFNFGGGLIYGIDRNFAAEIDVTRTEFGSNNPLGGDTGDFEIINVSLGGQYRLEVSQANLTPYAGVGLDILISDIKHPALSSTSIDTTVGVHFCGGIDYFLAKNVALNAEGKVVIAPETTIDSRGSKRGNFDPSSFSGMFGVRFFF